MEQGQSEINQAFIEIIQNNTWDEIYGGSHLTPVASPRRPLLGPWMTLAIMVSAFAVGICGTLIVRAIVGIG